MAEIEVRFIKEQAPYEFEVTIREGRSATQHRITLTHADYERLAGGQASPEALVTESFRFLLEREPKESILRAFDLTVISRYFPGYEREIQRRF
jgi:hypothetical protein